MDSVFCYVLGWPKSPFSFFHKMKDTFFIFTNNCIDLDILNISALSRYWLLVGGGQGCCKTPSNLQDSPTAKNYLATMSIVPRNFAKTFLTHSISHSISSNTAQIFFWISVVFLPFLKLSTYAESVAYCLPSSIVKWTKSSPILIFF